VSAIPFQRFSFKVVLDEPEPGEQVTRLWGGTARKGAPINSFFARFIA
jgi:hypothetical protein